MRRKLLIFTMVLMLLTRLGGQNLVMDPSIEEFTVPCCSAAYYFNHLVHYHRIGGHVNHDPGLISLCTYCFMISTSSNLPPGTTPEEEMLRNFHILPHSGNSFIMSIILEVPPYPFLPFLPCCISDYFQGELKEPLEAGREYVISFWASNSRHATYQYPWLGVYFSEDFVWFNTNQFLLLDTITPSAELGWWINWWDRWGRVEMRFKAKGGERYFVIGNFRNGSEIDTVRIPCMEELHVNCYQRMAVIYIDDISVYPADIKIYEADAGPDRYICRGDSVELGVEVEGDDYEFWWYDELKGELIGRGSKVRVSPGRTTAYRLVQRDFRFEETWDEVVVYVMECDDPVYVPNVFSPNGDGENDELRVYGSGIAELEEFEVYDRWGRRVYRCGGVKGSYYGYSFCGWDGRLNGVDVEEGVYGYRVRVRLGDGREVEKSGTVTLVR